MGIERRGNRTYYYEKERIGGRVVSRYVGRGEFAELVVRLRELTRDREEAERMERKQRERELVERWREDDRQVQGIYQRIHDLVAAELAAAGYHHHKGQWRKRREQDEGKELPDSGIERPVRRAGTDTEGEADQGGNPGGAPVLAGSPGGMA